MAPNPAAVYAMEKYGNYKIVKSDKGEFGVVELPNGEWWEAWSIYRKETRG